MQNVNGVVLLDKALHKTSNKALQEVKRLFQTKKAGHTGSLDPLATGLLPICLGEATKLSQYLLDANKGYIAIGQLGQQTTTADSDGELIKTAPYQHILLENLSEVLTTFLGHSKQIPPMYSALKQNGEPLYKLARQGIEVERKPRKIKIFKLDLLSFNLKTGIFKIEVVCSKGTYIRTLVEDIAKALDTVAFTKGLRRTQLAHYDIQDSISFEQLADNQSQLMDFLRPIESLLPEYPTVFLNKTQTQCIAYGQSIYLENSPQGLVKLFTPEKKMLAIGLVEQHHIKPKRLLMPNAINKQPI